MNYLYILACWVGAFIGMIIALEILVAGHAVFASVAAVGVPVVVSTIGALAEKYL